MLSPQQQLEETAKQVRHWKQTRINANSGLPISLREQLLALFEHFSVSELKQQIELSETSLRRWAKVVLNTKQETAASPTQNFISLPNTSCVSDSLLIELSIGNRCQMRLTGNLSTQQLDVITRNLFMYQSEANT